MRFRFLGIDRDAFLLRNSCFCRRQQGIIIVTDTVAADSGKDVKEAPFCGVEYRANEISAAILREQLKRMDGILESLRSNKKYVMDALASDFVFAPSNDIEGDCGTTLTFRFDTAEEVAAFEEKVGGLRPINTGKHVYSHWTPILEKRGAVHPLMDPFKMSANKDFLPDYREDICPVTLDILAKNVYVSVDPEWTKEDVDGLIEKCRQAK